MPTMLAILSPAIWRLRIHFLSQNLQTNLIVLQVFTFPELYILFQSVKVYLLKEKQDSSCKHSQILEQKIICVKSEIASKTQRNLLEKNFRNNFWGRLRIYVFHGQFDQINLLFIVFLKMLSESLWKKEKSFLQEEASNISVLKKQITKEAEIDASVQLSINQKIEKLKQNATALAKKLQNEKHKNVELDTIIRHMKGKIDQERLEEASFRDTNNSQNLNSLQNKFKKLEYDLGQINGKVNRMSENLQQKRSKVSQNRTERVIDSGIFRNIEKELIDSELTFKKLLIEKIRYQKQYQKYVQEYNSLKEKAENYYVRKDSTRTKTQKDLNNQTMTPQLPSNYKKKFLEIDLKRTNHARFTAQIRLDDDITEQQQKQLMTIKKMLIQTNLENAQDLVHYFTSIQQINDRYFNQINIYADQTNQIEKYLAEAEAYKKNRKAAFHHEKPHLSRQQLASFQYRQKQDRVTRAREELDEELKELKDFVETDTFKQLLKSLHLEPTIFIEDGYINFDNLSQTLQQLDKKVGEFVREPITIEEEKNTTSRHNNGPEKLEELINKVRKTEECMKVMKKEEFKDEYLKMLKSVGQKNQAPRSMNKKKSFPSIKK